MARTFAKPATQLVLRGSGVRIIETWLAAKRASVHELQAKLLEVVDTTDDSPQLSVEALRAVAEATSAGWTEADVRSSVAELLARHQEREIPHRRRTLTHWKRLPRETKLVVVNESARTQGRCISGS